MKTLTITTHHGDFRKVENFPVTDNLTESLKHALHQCAYTYTNVSIERAEILAGELTREGKTAHGWSWITLS